MHRYLLHNDEIRDTGAAGSLGGASRIAQRLGSILDHPRL